MSKLTAWLIRHGESMANVGKCTHKPAEIPLTEKGHRQVLQLAQAVSTRPDLIIVSPFHRAKVSASPIINQWQDVPVETWPIQELTYLAHDKYQAATDDEQQRMIDTYWQQADPLYSDGDDAESFADFMDRLQDFHQRLLANQGFISGRGTWALYPSLSAGITARLHSHLSLDETVSRSRNGKTGSPMLKL